MSTETLSLRNVTVSSWLNAAAPFEIPRGKVVAIHAFQMLCPGCVLHGIPQAQKLASTFSEEHVAVLGLHTVFEHHSAMTEVSLRAFLHEFRVSFPVGTDVPSVGSPIPQTMARFQMRGTPTWLVFNKQAELAMHAFGRVDDMQLGAEITRLVLNDQPATANLYRKGI